MWKSTKVAQYKLEFISENQLVWPIWILYFVYHFFSLSLQESSSKINKTWGQVFPSTRGKVRQKDSCATELTTELVLLAEGPEIFLKSIAEGPEMLAKTCIYCIKMYMTEGTWVIMNQLQRDLNDINNQWTRINAGC